MNLPNYAKSFIITLVIILLLLIILLSQGNDGNQLVSQVFDIFNVMGGAGN